MKNAAWVDFFNWLLWIITAVMRGVYWYYGRSI